MKFLTRAGGAVAVVAMIAIAGLFAAPAVDSQAMSENRFMVFGDEGDFITGGEDATVTTAAGQIGVNPLYIEAESGLTIVAFDNANTQFWTIDMEPPPGERFAAGATYTAEAWLESGANAGFSLSGNSRGCGPLIAEVEIYELSASPFGDVNTFAMDFRQSCDGGASWAVGGVRFNSALPDPDPNFRFDAGPPTCDGLVATIVGTDGPDELVGTSGRDVIAGLGGDDVIRGLRGNDVICGGSGNDTIRGDGGRDRLFGDAGHDKISGGAAADEIVGGAGRDEINGGTGADVLRGSGGADVLRGGPGDDYIAGQGGPDAMFGSWGADTLIGGLENDSAVGGGGIGHVRRRVHRSLRVARSVR